MPPLKVAFPMAGVILLPAKARACEVCVTWTQGQGLNGGFYWSALMLTVLPFAVVAVIGAWVGLVAWRARGKVLSHREDLSRQPHAQ